MTLTRKSIETLLDLVENKLGCMEVHDREDARELAVLEKARRELLSESVDALKGTVIAFPAGDAVAR